MVQVLQFRRRFVRQPGWSQQELAEFYRVESALTQAGLKLETDQGLSDEGDPWFVFCRPDTGDVIVHFARLGDEFVIDGFGYEHAARGSDFGALVRELISSDLFAVAKAKPKSGNVFLHPAALLIFLVGAAFLQSGQAKAGELHDKPDTRRPHGLVSLLGSSASVALPVDVDPVQAAALVAGAILSFDQQVRGSSPALQPPAEMSAARAPVSDVMGYVSSFATPIAASVGLVHDADLPSASITAVAGLSALANASAVPSGGSPAADAALQIALDVLPATPTLLLSMDGFPIAPTPAAFDGILLLGARTAALPADQAGDLLRGVVTPDHPVLTLNGALPGLVLSLIANGLHVAETANSIGGFPGAGPPVPNLVSPTPQSSDSSAGLAASAGAGGTSQTGAPHPHDPAIDAAVAQFIGGAPHWEVITSGRDVVVYDADILAPHSASALDSVTFTFSDGSSVSLVGTAAELLLAHSLH